MNHSNNDWLYSSDAFQTFFQQSSRSLVLKADPPLFTILAVSNDYLTITHKTRDEILNKPLFEVCPGSPLDPSGRTSVYNSFMRAIRTNKTDVLPMFKYEMFIAEKESFETQYWFNSNEPLLDGEGNVAYLVNTTVNITRQIAGQQAIEEALARKQAMQKESSLREETGTINTSVTNQELAETQTALQQTNRELEQPVADRIRALQNSQRRLQGILDTMAEGVGIVDKTGQLIYANAMAQQILGLKESEIKERTYHDSRWQNLRLDGTPLPENEHPMSIMMLTGTPVYDSEIGVKPPDKDTFYISINAVPIQDETGTLVGGIGTFRDVTQRRKLVEQKDDFISVASHELKTPLTGLKLCIELLNDVEESVSSSMLPALVERANSSIQKLEALMNDLLDVNRMSRGQLMLNKKEFRIADMVNDCCQHMIGSGRHVVDFQGDANQTVCADESRISQVMTNLLNNAFRYAPASEKIIIKAESLPGKIKVSVIDSGPGIPEEMTPRLFERYYRVDAATRQGGGLGLGLYISSEIIKSHGGNIGVQSEEGKGSSFWFTLPLVKDCV